MGIWSSGGRRYTKGEAVMIEDLQWHEQCEYCDEKYIATSQRPYCPFCKRTQEHQTKNSGECGE
jgi:Zn finger protein HypA/HybF involved in hydrogenase expression